MGYSLGHLPQFAKHREEVGNDPASPVVPNVKALKCQGYEKILLHLVTDATTPGTGTATLVAFTHDAESDTWVEIFSQVGATETTLYPIDVYGGDIRVSVRALAGTGVTKGSVLVAGAVPERAFNG